MNLCTFMFVTIQHIECADLEHQRCRKSSYQLISTKLFLLFSRSCSSCNKSWSTPLSFVNGCLCLRQFQCSSVMVSNLYMYVRSSTERICFSYNITLIPVPRQLNMSLSKNPSEIFLLKVLKSFNESNPKFHIFFKYIYIVYIQWINEDGIWIIIVIIIINSPCTLHFYYVNVWQKRLLASALLLAHRIYEVQFQYNLNMPRQHVCIRNSDTH